MGYTLSATEGTAKYLTEQGLRVTLIRKVHEGRPHCVDRIRSRQVDFVINTTSGRRSIEASLGIRRGCVDYGIPCITESDAAKAVLIALQRAREDRFDIEPLPKAFPI
jgi:carbamoyl-phosphate synthase large subunit